jgi:hypothetical protein
MPETWNQEKKKTNKMLVLLVYKTISQLSPWNGGRRQGLEEVRVLPWGHLAFQPTLPSS